MTRMIPPENRCVPVGDWPQADQAAWRVARQPAHLLDPTIGYASRWAPSTILTVESGYGRWLGWLAHSGQLDPDMPAADRATHARVSAYLNALREQGLADYSVAGRLQQLANALKAIAPEHDWSWIHRGSWRIHSAATPRRDRSACMRSPEEVLKLGEDMMAAADNDRFRTNCDRAKLFRDGLVIALLVHRPLRLANLTAIAIGRHLQRRGEDWWLVFDAKETKARRRTEQPWPGSLAKPLDRYMEVHRPVLLRCRLPEHDPIDGLWISQLGTPMKSDAMVFQIKHWTGEEFGEPINPHSFRAIAATAIATEDPENATDIMSVLSHGSMAPSERYYNRAKTIDAGRLYQATIAERRGQMRLDL